MYSLLVVQVRKILQVCWKEEQRERIGRGEGGRRKKGERMGKEEVEK